MGHHICQWLMLLAWAGRLGDGVYFAAKGRRARKPTGLSGVIGVLIYFAITAAVVWKSGAIDTIVGSQ